MRSLIALLVIFAYGCDVTQQLKPDVFYKRDAVIKFENQSYIGVAVLPKRAKYALEFGFAGGLDLFTFRTCHREITQEEFGGGGWFDKKSNKARYSYEPQPEIETGTACPIEVGGYEADKGRHGWAFVDFEGDREKLVSVIRCNGVRQHFNGVSACQTKAGLVTELVFGKPVMTVKDSECAMPVSVNGLVWRLFAPVGHCVYAFREIDGEKRYHRFTSIGYETILVRKVL